jgi:two-component system, OmpR family, response regulator
MAHILVVDDEDGVRDVLVAMLEEHGFRTTPANSGIAMREVLAGNGLPVDAVVLDCLMPGELGPDLALYAKSLHLPVVMISGSPDAMEFADKNGLQLLAKPFHFVDLIAAIEQALSSKQFGQRDA